RIPASPIRWYSSTVNRRRVGSAPIVASGTILLWRLRPVTVDIPIHGYQIELPKEDSEPQPDVTLLRPRADFYTAAHPVAADVLLLIEVADSTLAVDRRVRMPLYARAAIHETWLLDLTADRVEVYRAPTADGYQQLVRLERGICSAA